MNRASSSGFAILAAASAGLTAALTAGVPLGAAVSLAPEEADLVIRGGKVITVDRDDTIAQAVAVKDGVIALVGGNDEVEPLIGAETVVLDLFGRTLTPGLIDSHTHLMYYGQVEKDYVNLRPPGVQSIAEIVARIADRVDQTDAGEWVIGDGFFGLVDGRLPTRDDIDPVSPVNPVFLNSIGGHFGTANGRALEIAGIDSGTPDPVGGIIDRHPVTGEPTGILWNHPAMDLVRRHYPQLELEDLVADVAFAQETYLQHGLTSFQDVNTRSPLRLLAYQNAEDLLKLRGYLLFTIERSEDATYSLDHTALFRRPMLSYGGDKFLLDGQPPTSYTYDPHPGPSFDVATWDPDVLKGVVTNLHRAGHQLAFHVMGDRAIDLALDAIEEALADTPRPDHRHRLEHAMIPTTAAIDRIRRLGVVISAQPGAIYSGGDAYLSVWGSARIERLMPLRSFLDAGIPVALGSDFPTVPDLAPQRALWAALTRRTATGAVLAPSEAITMREALRAHTMGSAHAAFEEDIKGSIEVGKLADMSVWSDDPYSANGDEILDLVIESLIIGGKLIPLVASSARPCRADAQTACLLDDRYEVMARQWDFSVPGGQGGLHVSRIQGYPGVTSETDQSVSFYSFQEGNVEFFIKMNPGCRGFPPGSPLHSDWLWVTGATTAESEVVVTDTWTGEKLTISNPRGAEFDLVYDTTTFDDCEAPPVPGGCVRDRSTACLLDGRYRVQARQWDFSNPGGRGALFTSAIQDYPDHRGETDLSATFYSFQDGNVEFFVKMNPGCGGFPPGSPLHADWLWVTGATTAESLVRVHDTLTGRSKEIRNPKGRRFELSFETGAFPDCDLPP